MRNNVLSWVLCIALVFVTVASVLAIARLNDEVVFLQHRLASDGSLLVERSIPIVAVSETGNGVVATLKVRLIPGGQNAFVRTSPFNEPNLQFSVNKAVALTQKKTDDASNDFIFVYDADDVDLIGGESAGAATAILAIAAVEGKELKKDAVITGTIEADGRIGKVGGILEKARAVSEAGYKKLLVPAGQSKIVRYEKQVKEEKMNGISMRTVSYAPEPVDIAEIARQWNLEIVEVSTIDEALPYFF